MNIEPIKLSNISHISKNYWPNISVCRKLFYEYIDPNSITEKDLEPGDIVRISKKDPYENVWIYFDNVDFFEHSYYNRKILIRGDDHNVVMLLSTELYKNTWPESDMFDFYKVSGVWRTNINVDMFKKSQDILDFYYEYSIVETFNNL